MTKSVRRLVGFSVGCLVCQSVIEERKVNKLRCKKSITANRAMILGHPVYLTCREQLHKPRASRRRSPQTNPKLDLYVNIEAQVSTNPSLGIFPTRMMALYPTAF